MVERDLSWRPVSVLLQQFRQVVTRISTQIMNKDKNYMTTVKTNSLKLLSVLGFRQIESEAPTSIGDIGQAGFRGGRVRESLGVISTEVIIEITRVNEVTRGDLSTAEPCRFLECWTHPSRLRLVMSSGEPSVITTCLSPPPQMGDLGVPSRLAPNRVSFTLYYC